MWMLNLSRLYYVFTAHTLFWLLLDALLGTRSE